MINLCKITLKNFKIFGGEPYTISFEDHRLILLDGPNGYGKTSVFDAIELGITGNISRFISLENRQNPTDIVVAHQGTESVEVILEFKDTESNKRIFQRKLKERISNSSKKISKFAELWELNEVVNGVPIPSAQNTLNRYFNCNDFSRDFLLFHYVQQEETSRFLKTKNETQRAEELAQLFGNTREADERLKKLTEIYHQVVSSKRKTSNRIEELKLRYSISDHGNIESGTNEQHFYVLPWLADQNNSPFWDMITIPDLNHELLNKTLIEIISIKSFIEYKDYFIRNRSFETVINLQEVLKPYICYFNIINDYDSYVSQYRAYQLIKDSHVILASSDLKRIQSIPNIGEIFDVLNLGSSISFETALQSLIDKEHKANGLNSIYSELIKHHDSMFNGVNKLSNETSCLLCGQDYHKHELLSKAIATHGHLLRSELSQQDKQLVAARDTFNNTHLSPLLEECTTYLRKTPAPSQEDLHSFSKAVQMKASFEKLRRWLITENIQHDDLLIEKPPIKTNHNNIAEATHHLCERIRSAIGAAPDGYHEANISNVFDRIYRDYFNSQQVKLNLVNASLLDKKERYIKSAYFSSLRSVSEELTILSRQLERLEQASEDVNNLITIVNGKIKTYRKQLITDIEIPFYIYSGKILQTHQAGLGQGIFIKDPTGNDELKNVRLVSNWESDHDILNTMSSGQISAVVIALTLALHKVYATRFSSILIDDPVQTMDDINMSSLVELLRNDFSQKQIILSTHEVKVARYFTYKFLKLNESVKIVNLMQRKEYVPISSHPDKTNQG